MHKPSILVLAQSTAAIVLALSFPVRAQNSQIAASIVETAPLPASAIPANDSAAVNSPDRPDADKKLDPGRKPDQMLAFFGIKPGMKVADLWAGGGYTTELLSLAVGPSGKVYSQNGQFPERFKKIADIWHERLKSPALKNVAEVDKGFDAPDLLPVPAGSLDAVVMNLNYHDMVGLKMNRDNVNHAVFAALKPGGVYGIVDNSGQDGSGDRDTTTLHRIDEAVVIGEIKKAGFKLGAASSALRNPKDDRTWLVFKDRDHVDRFILKFVKPE